MDSTFHVFSEMHWKAADEVHQWVKVDYIVDVADLGFLCFNHGNKFTGVKCSTGVITILPNHKLRQMCISLTHKITHWKNWTAKHLLPPSIWFSLTFTLCMRINLLCPSPKKKKKLKANQSQPHLSAELHSHLGKKWDYTLTLLMGCRKHLLSPVSLRVMA